MGCPGAGCEDDAVSTTENVTGGAGSDLLGGNDADNDFVGGAGDDTFGSFSSGPDGADTYVGGAQGTARRHGRLRKPR